MRRWLIYIAAALQLAAPIPALALSRGTGAKVLYHASWQRGVAGWASTGGTWSVHAGSLIFDGTSQASVVAPFHLARSNYSLVAKIRMVRYRGSGVYVANSFGILFRARRPNAGHFADGLGAGVFEIRSPSGSSYSAAIITEAADPVQDAASGNYLPFEPSKSWHTYTVRVRGNDIRLSVDNEMMVDVTDKRFAADGMVGLFSSHTAIEVSAFRVISR